MSKYTMLKPMPQCGEGICSVVEIPDDVVKQIRSDAIDEFVECSKGYGNAIDLMDIEDIATEMKGKADD